MDDFWKTLLWQQFGAAIDMLEDATRACPDDLWSNVRKSRHGSRRALSGFGMSYTTRSSGWIFVYRNRNRDSYRGAELLLYRMRHDQHHVAQLNLLLRQSVDSAPAWVATSRS